MRRVPAFLKRSVALMARIRLLAMVNLLVAGKR